MNSKLLLLLCSVCVPSVIGQGNGAVRFYNSGISSHTLSSGIVQIYYNGQWGNVCDDGDFDLNAASVVCHQLSYSGAISYSNSIDDGRFGDDIRPSVIEDVNCTSDAHQVLLQCSVSSTYSSSCSNGAFGDVTVSCFTTRIWDSNSPFPLQVRLQDGDYVTEGRVEVYCSSSWGTVCDDFLGLDFTFSDTVCRQLGYTESLSYRTSTGSLLGSVFQPVWLRPLSCSSRDSCLSSCGEQCPSSDLTICSYLESIAVTCTYRESDFANAVFNQSSCSAATSVLLSTTTAIIIGGSAGGVILFILCICCCCCCYARSRKRRQRDPRVVVVGGHQAPTNIVVQQNTQQHMAPSMQAPPQAAYPAPPQYSNAPPQYSNAPPQYPPYKS